MGRTLQPSSVVEKYAPDAIIGVVGNGEANKAKGVAKSALLVATDKGDLEAWGDWRIRTGMLATDSQHHP